MKLRTFFLFLSGGLFLAALVYFVMDQRMERISFLQIQKTLDSDRQPLHSRKLEKPISKMERDFSGRNFSKVIEINDSKLLKLQEENCRFGQDGFEKNPDFVDGQSDFYKNEFKMKDRAEKMLAAYYDGLTRFKNSVFLDFNKVRTDPSLSDINTWRDVEETFSGCGKEADLGLFMLTIAESIKNKNVKGWFLRRAVRLAKGYLEFGTITGQVYSIGLLKNLVISKQLKGYLVHELYTLGEDIDRQAYLLREVLHNSDEIVIINFLRNHELRKNEFKQRAHEIMEEILLRNS